MDPHSSHQIKEKIMSYLRQRFGISVALACIGLGLSFGFGTGVALSDNPHRLEIKTSAGSLTLETLNR